MKRPVGLIAPVTSRRAMADSQKSIYFRCSPSMSRFAGPVQDLAGVRIFQIDAGCRPRRHILVPKTLFFPRDRESRVRYASRGSLEEALSSICLSTVHLTHDFRAKRASLSRRRASPPVHLRRGILSVSAFGWH